MQYNLAVGFALKEDWEKANNLMGQLYKEGQEVSVQVRTENLNTLRLKFWNPYKDKKNSFFKWLQNGNVF